MSRFQWTASSRWVKRCVCHTSPPSSRLRRRLAAVVVVGRRRDAGLARGRHRLDQRQRRRRDRRDAQREGAGESPQSPQKVLFFWLSRHARDVSWAWSTPSSSLRKKQAVSTKECATRFGVRQAAQHAAPLAAANDVDKNRALFTRVACGAVVACVWTTYGGGLSGTSATAFVLHPTLMPS